MAKEITPLEIKEAVDLLQTTVEKHGKDSASALEMAQKVNDALVKSEEQHQEIMAKQKETEQKALDLEDRIKEYELELAKKTTASGKIDWKQADEYLAMQNFVKMGEKAMSDEDYKILDQHTKTMRMDDGTAGGYLTTTEMDSSIIKTITEISPIRQIARVKSVAKKTLEIAKRVGIPTATYEGEAASGDNSQSQYANEQLTTYRLTTTVPYTMDLLMDSNFDLESEVNADVAEAYAFKEGNKFVLGTGAKEPEGFLINTELVAGARSSETAGEITGDDMILLTGDLKVGYNPMYGFNRQTLAFLRTLKGTDGHYLWQAGLAPNAPNTINGEPYVVIQDMPSIANNALAVVYGDFMRGYCITDRTGMIIIRDDVTQKKKAIIELTFHKWNTGQVVLSEAFKLLKVTST